MQLLIIAGTVGKDAKLRKTNSDDVLGFSLAVSNGKDRDGNDRPATWYDCSIWGKRAAALERHILKGTRLTLSGRPTAREHEGKAYLGISVDDLTFGGSAGGGSGGRSEGGRGGYDQSPEGHGGGAAGGAAGYGSGGRPNTDLDDEIPFSPEWR